MPHDALDIITLWPLLYNLGSLGWIIVILVDKWKLPYWDRDRMTTFIADDIVKCIFFNEKIWISIKISLKFVSKGPINNIPALV